MVERFKKSKWLKEDRVLGIEIALGNGKVQYHYTLLKRNKEQLSLSQSDSGLEDLEELKQEVGTNYPVALCITGRGMIHKELTISPEATSNEVIASMLPNARPSEFYLQEWVGTEHVFASIIRVDVADEYLHQFRQKGFRVVEVSLGGFDLAGIRNLLMPGQQLLEVGSYQLSFKDETLIDYGEVPTVESTSWKIGEEEIQSDNIVSFAAGFAFLFGNPGKVSPMIPMVMEARREQLHQSLFVKAGWTVLSVLLLVLLVNYLLFNYYSSQYAEKEATIVLHQEQLDQVEQLKQELQEKKKLVESTGISKRSRHAWYADQVAASVPQHIILTALQINPLRKKQKKGNRLDFHQESMAIEGKVRDSRELNTWIKALKTLNWVNEITILNYQQDKSKGQGLFEINITMT